MAQYQSNDGYNYIVFDGFQGGLQTTVEPNKIPDNASPFMENIVFDGGNSFQPRTGTSCVGETSSNYGGVKSMFNFKHSDGNEYMLRQVSSAIEYWNATTSAWSNIHHGFSTTNRFGYATYSIDDEVYMGNGIDAGIRWNGTTSASTSSVARGNLYLVHEARLLVAGLSAFPNTIYYSKPGDPLDFTGDISAAAGQGGVQRIGSEGDRITALKHYDDKIWIGKPDTLWNFYFNLDYGTSSETPIAQPILTSESSGPINNTSTLQIDDYFSWVTEAKKIKNLSQSNDQDRLSINNLSDTIEPTLNTLNFAEADAVYFDRKLLIACRETSSSFNNVVLVYDFKYKAWTKFNGWNVGAWVIWNGNLYYGDSVISRVYRTFTGNNDNGYNISTTWRSKEIDFGFPQIKKVAIELYVEGYITENTNITVKVYQDGDSSNPVRTETISGLDDGVDRRSSVAFGARTFGEMPYGGNEDTATSQGYKFRRKIEIPAEDFHTAQIEISSDGDGQIYRITHLGFLVKLKDRRIFNYSAIS